MNEMRDTDDRAAGEPTGRVAMPRAASRARRADPEGANTLVRGLRVLECFSANDPILGNGDISRLTGLPKPTVSRLTHALRELGYLRHASDSSRFEVGPAALCLGYPLLARLAFQRLSVPHLRKLSEDVDGLAVIAIRDRFRIVTLELAGQRDVFKRRPNTGSTRDFFGSTLGRAWLVGASAAERDGLMREVAQDAPEQIERVRGDYEASVQQLLRLGYMTGRNILLANTCTVAIPLRRNPGEDLLVLAVGFETTPENVERLEQRGGRLLVETSKLISDALKGG